jgi:hypothetical protein
MSSEWQNRLGTIRVLSDGRGAGSNRDYLVGATMIGSLSGQDTAAGQTIPSPYAA